MNNYRVCEARRGTFEWLLYGFHYAGRVPSVSFAFCLWDADEMIGVVTFGSPGSHHVQISACQSDPSIVIELNRLCVLDHAPKNTASWFLSKALTLLPPRIVVSYADTLQGHTGIVYRAANFKYAGWTDMERKTPRYDYVVEGKHSRCAFRNGTQSFTSKIRRKPKIKYWTVTGNKRDKKKLAKLCTWPDMDWGEYPAPMEHKQITL